MSDRTVHASSAAVGIEVVRYDRAGKWYVEGGGLRRPLTLRGAVRVATRIAYHGGDVWLGLPGGAAFDRLYQKRGTT